MTQLYTFWVSHFSEKARWCLDYEGVPFEDTHLLPGPHVLTVRKLAPRSEVPLLIHEGEIIQGSGAIIDAIPRLFGKTRLQPWLAGGQHNSDLKLRCEELELWIDECFGRSIQGLAYDVILNHREHLVELWAYKGPWWAASFYWLIYPMLKRDVRKKYCPDPESGALCRAQLLSGLDRMDAILETSPYLLGEVPTRADITVAALLSPLVRPPEHPMQWPDYPQELVDLAASLEGRRTIEFVRHMYREHRNQNS
jgi:glutathione S-transferase